jgi:hypothetical protein
LIVPDFRAKNRPLSIECLFSVKIKSKVTYNLTNKKKIIKKILTSVLFFD